MSEPNNPKGIDLGTAQNAIMDMIAPKEDTASEPEALEAEVEEVIEAEAEMPEEEATDEEVDTDLANSKLRKKLKSLKKNLLTYLHRLWK